MQIVWKRDEAFEVAGRLNRPRDRRHAQMTPISFPSRAKVSSAKSICSGVWVAMRLVRRRHSDGGTAGGTTGLVKTPASKSFRQNMKVVSSGPIRTGTIGVCEG